jgi:hypothetical protein
MAGRRIVGVGLKLFKDHCRKKVAKFLCLRLIGLFFVPPARHRPPEADSGEAGGFVFFVVRPKSFSALSAYSAVNN